MAPVVLTGRLHSHGLASSSGRRAALQQQTRTSLITVAGFLFSPPVFNPAKLQLSYLDAATQPPSPFRTPRCYTLTHSDLTGQLQLSIGSSYNQRQLSGWYVRLVRDEVLGEWHWGGGPGELSLQLHCHVSGEEFWLAPPELRSFIFRREMTLVLDMLNYAESAALAQHPELALSRVTVHLSSDVVELHESVDWGQFGVRSSWRKQPAPILEQLRRQLGSWSLLQPGPAAGSRGKVGAGLARGPFPAHASALKVSNAAGAAVCAAAAAGPVGCSPGETVGLNEGAVAPFASGLVLPVSAASSARSAAAAGEEQDSSVISSPDAVGLLVAAAAPGDTAVLRQPAMSLRSGNDSEQGVSYPGNRIGDSPAVAPADRSASLLPVQAEPADQAVSAGNLQAFTNGGRVAEPSCSTAQPTAPDGAGPDATFCLGAAPPDGFEADSKPASVAGNHQQQAWLSASGSARLAGDAVGSSPAAHSGTRSQAGKWRKVSKDASQEEIMVGLWRPRPLLTASGVLEAGECRVPVPVSVRKEALQQARR